ncbi:UDP-glucose dehydrogenase family protein [Terriglobus roseus]|uniref:UDP-glucose 6-dehydrogenase n=1 Tax=Terriglobus roseus TaxID=392734 RepID=A0A1H4JNG2_9BACT|nr:nucleotide sugar dehydrogenase [Terriglobus roseus]SEB47803.1 GDP-mannose 6-dehydrogenase [Terriglobus roseus]
MESASSKNVIVMGLGYVGCVSSACLASLGHKVLGVDRDQYKVSTINQRRSPFYEPGLEELIEQNVSAGRLRAGGLDAEAIAQADVVLLCVGTPSQANGNIDLSQLRRVCAEIADLMQPRERPLVVTVRSTVFPGTCESLQETIFSSHANVAVASNPEFLREGTAVKDFLEPSLLVVGGTTEAAAELVAGLYDGLPVERAVVSLRTAEMIKYACNAFHAVKIGFANEIGSLAAELGVDPMQVMETMCKDVKLNISPAYMKPGFAFGGSCLPKDLRALTFRASRLDVKLPMLEAVLPANEEHLRRSIRDIFALPGKRIGIFGLAFKEDTDDLRESPVITIVEHLLGKGRETRIFDPHIRLDEIYGSNLSFVVSALPHIGRLMERTLDGLLGAVDAIVIAQKPTAETAAAIRNSGLPVLDLTKLSLKPSRPPAAN